MCIRNRFIDQRFELRIIFAQHTAVGFFGLRRADNHPVIRFFRFGALTGQQGIIHHKGDRAAGLQGTEGIPVIFGADNAHLHLLLIIEFVEQHFRCGTGCDHHVFPGEIGKVFDTGIFTGQQTGTDHKNGVGEGGLLLTGQVVGGGAALKIECAVL